MPIGGALALVSIGTTVYTQIEARKAQKEEEKANKKAARIEAIKGRNERANALRQNRISAAEIFAQAANAGVQGSSPVQGAIGSLNTRSADAFRTSAGIDQLEQQRIKAITSAQGHQSNIDTATAVGSLGTSLIKIGGKYAGA